MDRSRWVSLGMVVAYVAVYVLALLVYWLKADGGRDALPVAPALAMLIAGCGLTRDGDGRSIDRDRRTIGIREASGTVDRVRRQDRGVVELTELVVGGDPDRAPGAGRQLCVQVVSQVVL